MVARKGWPLAANPPKVQRDFYNLAFFSYKSPIFPMLAAAAFPQPRTPLRAIALVAAIYVLVWSLLPPLLSSSLPLDVVESLSWGGSGSGAITSTRRWRPGRWRFSTVCSAMSVRSC